MGNCCDIMNKRNSLNASKQLLEIENSTEETSSTINRIANVSIDDVFVETDVFSLQTAFGDDDFNRLKGFFFSEQAKYSDQLNSLKKVDYKHFFGCETFVNLFKKEASNEYINVIKETLQSNYKADFLMFAFVNQKVKLNASIEVFEIVLCEVTEDTIYMLERIKTKKIFMIASRDMYYIRVIKKINENTYIDLLQTVDTTDLGKYKTVREVFSRMVDQPATIFVSGHYIENKDGYSTVNGFTKNDFHSTVGFTLSAPFIGKTFENSIKNLNDNCEAHIKAQYKILPDYFVWFKSQADNKEGSEKRVPEFLMNPSLVYFHEDPKTSKEKFDHS
jgi:hypothetical protein